MKQSIAPISSCFLSILSVHILPWLTIYTFSFIPW
jgi:hypothetical protein